MYDPDPEHGWSLSFAGCGFLGFYHLGVTHCLSDRAPHLLRNARMFFGASSGSMHCVTFLAGVPLARVVQVLTDLVRQVRSQSLGILHPSFNMHEYFREALHRHLPANVHQLVSGKVGISLTRVSDWENVLVSDFQSKDEVVDALLCSCFIPFVCGVIPPSFRGVRYVDGGITNSVPFFDTKKTITVSPFYGECDICPKAKSTNFFHVDVSKLNVHVCLQNCQLLFQMLFPPDVKVLGEICLRGYLDAARFLEKNGFCDRPPPPCLSLSSEEREVLRLPRETRSLEASREGAGWWTRLEGDGLLDHLRRNLLPWDDSILQTVSPKLTAALSEVAKTRGGCLSKIRSFLPVKVLTYAMLPCTLPVESAVAAAHRLVTWLPDVPDDVQWLQSMACQACSRVTTHLFPTCRLVVGPAARIVTWPLTPRLRTLRLVRNKEGLVVVVVRLELLLEIVGLFPGVLLTASLGFCEALGTPGPVPDGWWALGRGVSVVTAVGRHRRVSSKGGGTWFALGMTSVTLRGARVFELVEEAS